MLQGCLETYGGHSKEYSLLRVQRRFCLCSPLAGSPGRPAWLCPCALVQVFPRHWESHTGLVHTGQGSKEGFLDSCSGCSTSTILQRNPPKGKMIQLMWVLSLLSPLFHSCLSSKPCTVSFLTLTCQGGPHPFRGRLESWPCCLPCFFRLCFCIQLEELGHDWLCTCTY